MYLRLNPDHAVRRATRRAGLRVRVPVADRQEPPAGRTARRPPGLLSRREGQVRWRIAQDSLRPRARSRRPKGVGRPPEIGGSTADRPPTASIMSLLHSAVGLGDWSACGDAPGVRPPKNVAAIATLVTEGASQVKYKFGRCCTRTIQPTRLLQLSRTATGPTAMPSKRALVEVVVARTITTKSSLYPPVDARGEEARRPSRAI